MTSPLTIVFCGTPDFAVPSLRALVTDDRFNVTLVITQPDRPVGRAKKLMPSPVKAAAQELGISVWQPENLNRELLVNQSIFDARPDFLVVIAYGQILKQATLDWPKTAPINVHGSLLPRWRGASPIEQAILHGDSETGVTIQRMVYELDAGPMLGSASTELSQTSTAASVRDDLSKMSAELLVNVLSQPLRETPQPSTGITICRKLSREDGKANPGTETAQSIERMVRAFDPWPGVTLTTHGHEIKVLRASLEATPDSLELPCAEGTVLYLIRVQEAGKRPISGRELARKV